LTQDKLDVLKISGGPYERGEKYGKEYSKKIGGFIDYLYSEFGGDDTTKEDFRIHSRKYFPFIEEFSPAIYKELEGVAAGSGRPLEEIVMVSLHEERDTYSNLSRNCTTYAATGAATGDGSTFLGQTWDITPDLCRSANPFLLKVEREAGPDFMAYTYPGMIAGAGVNEAGIGVSFSSVPRLNFKPGVPSYVMIEGILRQGKIGDALSKVLQADRAGCFNFILADESEVYDIEGTPDDVEVFHTRSTFGHTNHYIAEKFRHEQDICEVGGRSSASSIVRHNRINRLLEENSGNIDKRLLMEILRDHVNFPQSICRHPEPVKKDEVGVISCGTWVIDTTNKEFWIAKGPMCENEFYEYFKGSEA